MLTEASTTTMTSTECPGCTIEVFLAMPDAGDAGHGEGASLLGRTIAAGSGAWSVPLAVGAVGSGDRVTATATTPPSTVAPQSSEFAVNITVG